MTSTPPELEEKPKPRRSNISLQYTIIYTKYITGFIVLTPHLCHSKRGLLSLNIAIQSECFVNVKIKLTKLPGVIGFYMCVSPDNV